MTGKADAGHGFGVAAGVFAIVGLGFMILAAHLWLQNNYRPDVAAALTGAIALFMALLMAFFSFCLIYYKQSEIKKLQKEIKNSLQEGLESLDNLLADPVRENPKTAALAASLAGFFVGEKSFP